MKAKKTIGDLAKAGWMCQEVSAHKQHYVCAGTGQMGSRERGKKYVATLAGCDYRLEFYVLLADFVGLDDEHSDIQILHKSEPSNALGCMRAKTVRRAIDSAIQASELSKPKSHHALFDGSNAHLLDDAGDGFEATHIERGA